MFRDARPFVGGICPILLVSLVLLHYLPAHAQSGQFKTYNDAYGRFSIQVPKSWTIGSPSIKQDSVTVDFSPNNKDDFLFIVAVMDRHGTSETDFEQAVKEQNAYTVQSLPGQTLIQDTDCTKYVIDGNKACSMIYHHGMTDRKEMEVDFLTGKQWVGMSILGSDFDKYLPIANQMLNSMEVS